MKKFFSAVLAATLTVSAILATGCNGKTGNDDPGTLRVEFLKAGYGTQVYEALATEFMAQNTDIKVKLIANESINSTTENRLQTNTSISDVYQVSYWGQVRRWATKGYVMDLTSLYGEEVENGQTLRDRIAVSGRDAFSLYNKYYAIPHEASISGLLYNVKMFEENGWKVPKTTKELKDLCDKIAAANIKKSDPKVNNGKEFTIKPLVYCGSTSDGYWPSTMNTWWLQYSGAAKLNEFAKFESPEVYKDEGRLRALELLYSFIMNDKKYCPPNVMSKDHITAQLDFIQGKAAMLPCGSWFQTEMQLYLKEFPDFEYALMPTPVVSDDNGNSQAADEGVKYLFEGSAQCWFVAAKTKNADAAKKWIKFISSQKACEIWTANTGAIYAYNYDTASLAENANSFTKSLISIWNECTPYKFVSNHPLAIESKVGMWPQQQSPFVTFKNTATTTEQYYEADYNYVKANWSAWNS